MCIVLRIYQTINYCWNSRTSKPLTQLQLGPSLGKIMCIYACYMSETRFYTEKGWTSKKLQICSYVQEKTRLWEASGLHMWWLYWCKWHLSDTTVCLSAIIMIYFHFSGTWLPIISNHMGKLPASTRKYTQGHRALLEYGIFLLQIGTV